MTEAAVEKEICKTCGADVRPDADYCYNCGAAVSAAAIAKNTQAKIISPARAEPVRENIIAAKTEIESKQSEPAKLQTAAALRRQSKNVAPKVTEIVWTEHEADAANVWFIFAAIALTLLAAGILLLALYLK